MQRKKPPTSIRAERRSACRRAAAKTTGDGEQQQFLRHFGQRGFMHEVVQPVYVDKHRGRPRPPKTPESANAPIFPSKSFNSSCIISLIIVLKRAYGRQLSLQGVAIDAKRRPLPANCGEEGHKK